MTGKFYEKLVIAPIKTVTEYHEIIQEVLREAYIDLPRKGSSGVAYEEWTARWFADI